MAPTILRRPPDTCAQNTIAYVIDPRFAGGTSSAVARELRVLAAMGLPITVCAITSAMFHGSDIAPVLAETLEDIGCPLVWDPSVITADTVLLHNPAFLKFDTQFTPRILARQLIVITHENFLRPGGAEGFDVAHCLSLIDRRTLAQRKSLAPISAWNRHTVEGWRAQNPAHCHWSLQPEDWFNICDFDLVPPTPRPRDRRGRHSRAGYEKFPALADMDACFPASAQANVLLGTDTFLADRLHRPHWRMIPFRGMNVADFFDEIDFHVYFTTATWRESFGRVLAEALAAGKLVISDPDTARVYDGGVVGARPEQVDDLIAGFVQNPARYQEQVRRGQDVLRRFSSDHFGAVLARTLMPFPQEVA